MSSNDRLSEAISKNLALIKREATEEEAKKEGDEDEENPIDLINRIPSINPSTRGEFDFSANRTFFDDVYFKNSRLIKMLVKKISLNRE